jgi:glucan 1,3-beta-glucosidase
MTQQLPWWESRPLLRGVNLGGWLLLERWLQQRVFADTDAVDERSFSAHWGSHAESVLRRHRETYITRDDFVWLAAHGLNAVRIPFGYWLLAPEPPFVGGADILDEALRWCGELGLMAILDLHGLPGGQNGAQHSGQGGRFDWPEHEQHRQRSLDVLEEIARRWAHVPCVRGIGLVNEPSPEIPASLLDAFYREAYRRIRKHMPYERVAVVIPAFPESRLPEFHGRYPPHEFENVITDLHYYHCFGEWFEQQSLERLLSLPLKHCFKTSPDRVRRACEDRLPEVLKQPVSDRLEQIRAENPKGWLMVGEWSLRLPWQPHERSRSLPHLQRNLAMRAFAATQILAYEHTQGWFFWTYKAEGEPEWSFRDCVARGWLPDQFA